MSVNTFGRSRPPKFIKINDKEREEKIINFEPWYLAHKRSGMSMRNFIKANKKEIDDFLHVEYPFIYGPKE